MANIALWKILLAQIPSVFPFLCEFPSSAEKGDKPTVNMQTIISIVLAGVLWYFLATSTSLAEQAKKDKEKIASLTGKVTELSIVMNQEKSAKERKMDQIDLLKARLREEEADSEKLNEENQRRVREIAGLETKLSLCQGRTFTCDTYKPSLDLLVELGKLNEEKD